MYTTTVPFETKGQEYKGLITVNKVREIYIKIYLLKLLIVICFTHGVRTVVRSYVCNVRKTLYKEKVA